MPDSIVLIPGSYVVPQPPPIPPPVNTTLLVGLNRSPFELLWGVGRSKPITNPPIHGTATWTPGEPGVLDFHPALLPGGESDNILAIQRLGQYLPDFSQATKFSESQIYTVNDTKPVQALETDWHMQIGTKVWNPGLQLFPGKPNWSVRGFDYINKVWVPLGVTFDPAVLLTGCMIGGNYTISQLMMSHTAVTINGLKFPVSFAQSVATAAAIPQPAFVKSVQADANSLAQPYVLKVGKMQVSWA
jgi:hypothetical protein